MFLSLLKWLYEMPENGSLERIFCVSKKNPDKNVDLRKTGNVVNAESLPQFSGFD